MFGSIKYLEKKMLENDFLMFDYPIKNTKKKNINIIKTSYKLIYFQII